MHKLRKRFTNGGSQMVATIKDVAKKANVSISTVSRVLSNQMHVSSSTYKRIQDAVAELNYIPNSSAVSLVKKSSTTVLYADSFYKGRPYENPHMFDIISGSSHELRKKGYFLGLLDLDRSKEKAEEQIINAIQSKKADGILINGYYVTPAIEKVLLATDFPHICIGKPSFDSMLSWIDTNHSLSSNLAITHLVSLGHKKIAFVGGSDKDNIYRDRFLGYRLSLERNNLSPRDAYVIPTSCNLEEIIQHTTELLRLPEPPDSILCFNSLIAVGVIQAIRQFRLRIPEDISIVSFDNYPYAPLITPSLTVVDIDMYSLGTRAGASLLKKIQNPEMLIQTYTALPHLIQRDSTVLHSET